MLFLQAEYGIRDIGVTGVQTCALPICRGGDARRRPGPGPAPGRGREGGPRDGRADAAGLDLLDRVDEQAGDRRRDHDPPGGEVGRAACWGRVEISVGAGYFKKKKNEVY